MYLQRLMVLRRWFKLKSLYASHLGKPERNQDKNGDPSQHTRCAVLSEGSGFFEQVFRAERKEDKN